MSLDNYILEWLARNGVMDRDWLARVMHVPRTTVYDDLKRLEGQGLVRRENEFVEGRRQGRPRVLWRLAR